MRTPKIEALHRAIVWFNRFYNHSLYCKTLDKSPVDSNSWLAGFSHGDGNFSISLTNHKKKGKNTSKRVQTFFFRIELRQNYHGVNKELTVLSLTAQYLNVNLYTRTRQHE